MEAGDYIAAGSAAVAAAAACTAWWHALTAARAARAADTRARTALAQVELVREQLAHERALRDKADCPVFAVVETDVHHGNGTPVISLVLTQTGGSPVSEARVTVHLNDEPAVVVRMDGDDGVLTWRHIAPGATRTLKIKATGRHRGELEIRVDLTCREAGGERQWTCHVFGYVHGDWRRYVHGDWRGNAGAHARAAGPEDDPRPTYAPELASEGEGLPHYPWVPEIPFPRIARPDEIGLLALTPSPARTRAPEPLDPGTAPDLGAIW